MEAIDWNGRDLPEALRDLPPGRYLLMEMEDAPIADSDETIVTEALDALERGEHVSHDDARRRLARWLDG